MKEKELTFKEIVALIKSGKKVKINSPYGYSRIIDYYIKKDTPGYKIIFDDNSFIKCAETHRLLIYKNDFKWITANKLQINDISVDINYNLSKKIIKIEKLPNQDWIDFAIDNPGECYVQNDIIHHNSGKSLILYICALYNNVFNPNNNVLLIVPNISLVHQMASDFKEYGIENISINKLKEHFNIPIEHSSEGSDKLHVHKIYSGQEKDFNKNIILSTWQSIYKEKTLPDIVEANPGMVLIDETHLAKDGKKISNILTSLKNTKYKIGCTGSIPKSKVQKYQMMSLTGNIFSIIKARELINKNYATDISIISLLLERNNEISKMVCNMKYHDEEKFFYNNPMKVRFITEFTKKSLKKHKKILIFFRNISYGQALLESFKNEGFLENENLFYIDGSIDGKVREETRNKIEKNEMIIGIVSYKTFSTGINVKSIEAGILGQSAGKSAIQLIQSIGRFLRQSANKDMAYMYDIVDYCKYKSKFNYGYKHFLERLNIYRSESHNVIERKIKIP